MKSNLLISSAFCALMLGACATPPKDSVASSEPSPSTKAPSTDVVAKDSGPAHAGAKDVATKDTDQSSPKTTSKKGQAPSVVASSDKPSKEEIAAQKAADKAAKAEERRLAGIARAADKETKKAAQLRSKGPYQPDVDQYANLVGPSLNAQYVSLFKEGERNAVLNFNRIGLAELESGNLERAKWAFDQSISRISLIYANDDKAKAAKSIWTAEAIKDFKGEPYERAMAYYYRGIIDLAEGDYQNARASFKEGEYQDTISEAEEFEGDFSVLSFLSGWASHCDGDRPLADEFFGFAAKTNERIEIPGPEHNTLLISEIGRGPSKATTGQYNEYLKMVEGYTPNDGDVNLDIKLMNATELVTMPAIQASDISYQATTRGGRPFQAVLNGKAEFKEVSGVVASAAVTTGVAMMASNPYGYNDNTAAAGAIVALFGLVAAAASEAATPEADKRYWDNLPNQIVFRTLNIQGDKFEAKSRIAISEMYSEAPASVDMMIAGAGRCKIAWAKHNMYAYMSSSAPYSETTERLSKAMLAKDAEFRVRLLAEPPPPAKSIKPGPTPKEETVSNEQKTEG